MSHEIVVVVATNNGKVNLERFFSRPHRHPVVVVDTGSTDPASTAYLDEVRKNPSVLGVLHTPYRGYDTGAYLWAYFYLGAVFKNYLFLQDSMFPRDDDYVEKMLTPLGSKWGVHAWAGFDLAIWDSEMQARAVGYMLKHPTRQVNSGLPTHGIFGPTFLASRDALDYLRDTHLLPSWPTHKEMAQAMERAWAIAFYQAGVPMHFLVREGCPNREKMERGEYPIFTKTFGGRE